ncbi:GNAT family N-acetyltransferase [Sphingomicrobium sediminis]|uniref:GNAT family N-acetyltransferase n=1 Tax=Sphingomicrobium sediminis TaxID=2950949 RepID=A0A9X2EKD4_9SPHN|nr:GNAT family protein [Sphingomicrobium sediminis]MCM8556964.1 GNAT family N-acetyltransferase [Sphingomicrobium sediminis]
MTSRSQPSAIRFERLESVEREVILAHMLDPRIAKHLPLLDEREWDLGKVDWFVGMKAAHWEKHGFGHWAIFIEDEYAGWGGFEKDGDGWDFGLVLHPDHFRSGARIAAQAFAWAREHTQIERVTALLPLSRSERALQRHGARPIGEVEAHGLTFRKWEVHLREE